MILILFSREGIIEIYKEVEEKAGKIRLEVNERKIGYMIMSTSEGKLFTEVV
jgi:hypothetical protein